MKLYKVPIDFTVMAKDPDDCYRKMQDFLRASSLSFAPQYDVEDWEAPVDYPIEEIRTGDCAG